jgi:hypothetical protein
MSGDISVESYLKGRRVVGGRENGVPPTMNHDIPFKNSTLDHRVVSVRENEDLPKYIR